LTKKFHELSALLTLRDIDVMCVTETRLKVESKLSEIVGFQTFRRDATSSSERGVAIICKSNLTARIHDMSQKLPVNPNIEYFALSIQYAKTKSFLVVVVYRHPNYLKETKDNDYSFFQSLISSLVESTKMFFILGDFNLRDDHSYHPLDQIITTSNCHQIIDEPTRLNKKLDLIIINDPASLVSSNVYQPHLSDHCLTQIDIRTPKIIRKKITIQYRDFKNIDVVGVRTHLNSLENSLRCEMDPFKITTSTITNCFNIYAPKKIISIVQYPYRKYISSSTKSLIKQRDRLYQTEKRFSVHSEQLLNLNKKIRSAIKYDTKSELDRKIEQSSLWHGVKKLFPKSSMPSEVFNEFTPNQINDYFVSISMPTTNDNDQHHLIKPHQLETFSNLSFEFTEVSDSELRAAWKRTKNKKSTSEDINGISPAMLDYAMESPPSFQSIRQNMNECIEKRLFPKSLKISRVVPVPKVSNPLEPSQFRPIAVQPHFGKLFEKCLFKQLSDYLESNSMINENQFGFRRRHSISHACIALSDYIYESLDRNHICFVISLDIMKAFDKVDRSLLIEKLAWYGVNSDLVNSFLSDRHQFVQLVKDNCVIKSSLKETLLGLPQGSSLSNLLFTVMINDLVYSVKHCKLKIYADDTNIYISGPIDEITSLIQLLEEDLQSIDSWMTRNKLKLNVSKTTMMIIAPSSFRDIISDVTFTSMELVSKESNL
jgi:hypothetical protein